MNGGLNTYGYVGGNPLYGSDPYGLYTVHSGFTPDLGLSFTENARRKRDYMNSPAGQREQLLINLGQAFQARINKCQSNRDEIQKIFDNWQVSVDPNIDGANRSRTAADTDYGDQTTQFNFWFFNGDRRSDTFAHEFRHLMPGNNALYGDGSYIGNRLRGNAARHPGEVDADKWANSFRSGDCGC